MVDCSKIITDEEIDLPVKIGTFNIANSRQDERNEDYKLSKRQHRLIQLIMDQLPDFMVINELRPYTHKGKLRSRSYFLSKIGNNEFNYEYVLGSNNADELAFGNGIVYNPKKWFIAENKVQWLSETPNVLSRFKEGSDFGRCVLCAKFYPVKDGLVSYKSKPIWIFAVHFDLSEEAKERSVKILPRIVKSCVSENDRIAIMGDMNFFEDEGKRGKEFREMFENEGYMDVGKNTTFSFDSNIPCYSTFVGFPYDKFKLSYEDLKNDNRVSRLDHIFTKNMEMVSKTARVIVSLDDLTAGELPSDHLPLIAEMKSL